MEHRLLISLSTLFSTYQFSAARRRRPTHWGGGGLMGDIGEGGGERRPCKCHACHAARGGEGTGWYFQEGATHHRSVCRRAHDPSRVHPASRHQRPRAAPRAIRSAPPPSIDESEVRSRGEEGRRSPHLTAAWLRNIMSYSERSNSVRNLRVPATHARTHHVVIGHRYRYIGVVGRWSLVVGRWSLVVCRVIHQRRLPRPG
jgi:hypothetical protein